MSEHHRPERGAGVPGASTRSPGLRSRKRLSFGQSANGRFRSSSCLAATAQRRLSHRPIASTSALPQAGSGVRQKLRRRRPTAEVRRRRRRLSTATTAGGCGAACLPTPGAAPVVPWFPGSWTQGSDCGRADARARSPHDPFTKSGDPLPSGGVPPLCGVGHSAPSVPSWGPSDTIDVAPARCALH